MSRSHLILTTVAVIAGTAATQSGCGSSQQPAGTKTTRGAAARVSSSIPPGGELSRPLTWQATFTGTGASDITGVRFLIDGNVRHAERNAPYVFAGDGNQLLPGTLKPGTHTFAIDAELADGKRLTTATTATVAPGAPSIPPAVLGRWKRHVTAADTRRTAGFRRPVDGEALPTGTWTVQIGADGVARYTDPTGLTNDQTVGQVNFAPSGRLLVGNLIPNVAGTEGYFCHDPHPDGVYRWSLHQNTLVVRVVADRGCADRNSFWNGRFTR